MFTCSNCGASVREGAKFCTSCGTRLNDTSSTSPESTWSTSSSPETAPSSNVEPTTSAAIQAEDTGVSVPNDSDTQVDDNAASGEGFTWSWGKAEASADAPPDAIGLVEVESGVVIGGDESNAEHASGTIVDATEIEILEVEPAMSSDDKNTEPQTEADTSEIDEVVFESVTVTETDEGGDTETLAAWAEQWNEPADVDTSASAAADSSGDEESPEAAQQVVDDEEEDTVAKAERLIGELRAVIPALVRPRPAATVVSADSSALADQLASAAQSDNFDDLREALETVRDNPRDIDSMLKLSGQADRLLALLDDRNNLAKSAEDAASQLRGTITPELI